uniref:B1620_F1_14 n=1 Tax=Mycobacterium leprae TaxID=1769 RepID=Q49735_MYCLR|nr:B1620_F1_14 [Mycobacterium leprae]
MSKPLQPECADHIAAVVLFGMTNFQAMNFLGESPVAIGPAHQAKAIKVGVPKTRCALTNSISLPTTVTQTTSAWPTREQLLRPIALS